MNEVKTSIDKVLSKSVHDVVILLFNYSVHDVVILLCARCRDTRQLSPERRNYAASCAGSGEPNLASSLVLV
jgi:hypothetical protein